MTTSVKVIKFSWKICVALCLLTYLVSLNKAYGLFDLKWLSNDFLFTIVGGTFASMLVVLLCEIQKYLHLKRETEWQLFTHVGHIYAQLRVAQVTLNSLNENSVETVTDNLLHTLVDTLKKESAIVENLDFAPFLKDSDFHKRHLRLQKWLLADFAKFVSNCIYLQIASNTDKIENLKNFGHEGKITSASTLTGATIRKLLEQSTPLVQYADAYMEALDKYCNGRFLWQLRKASVEMAFDLKETTLEDFLSKEATT